MIVLDTNVVSAMMAPSRNGSVIAWLDRQAETDIWISTITVMETRYGLSLLPVGKRRGLLEAAFVTFLSEDLEDRVLPFDRSAAEHAAEIAVALKTAGRPIDFRDIQIAAIARSRRAAVATRNVRHFAGTGVQVIDPWAD